MNAADGAVAADLRPRRRAEPAGPAQPRQARSFVVDHAPCPVLLVWPVDAPGVDSIPPPPAARPRAAAPAARALSPTGGARAARPGPAAPARREVAVRGRPRGVDVGVAVDASQRSRNPASLASWERKARWVRPLPSRNGCKALISASSGVRPSRKPARSRPRRWSAAARRSNTLRGGGRDQVGQAERAAGLDDEHGAQLPRPRVDVLEDRPVERAQVVEVVLARDRGGA